MEGVFRVYANSKDPDQWATLSDKDICYNQYIHSI